MSDRLVALGSDPATGLATVSVLVNGKGPYAFIVDTGAQATVIDAGLQSELRLPDIGRAQAGRPGSSGPVHVPLVRIDDLSVGATHVTGVPAVVLQLASIWPGQEAPKGVLSVNAFAGAIVALDYQAGTLQVVAGSLPQPDGRDTFAWESDRPIPSLGIDVQGRRISADLDTGSTFALVMPRRYATELDLQQAPTPDRSTRGFGGELPTERSVLRGTVRVGPNTYQDLSVNFADVPFATVGYPALKELRLVIDASGRRLQIVR